MKKRASKTLKDLKEKRVAFSIGGYGGIGGGSMEGTTVYGQPTSAGTSTDYSSYANTSSGGVPAGNFGTPSYGGGGGNATGSSVTTGKVEDTAEGIEEEEVEVKEPQITEADLVKSKSGLYLVRDTYVNEEGDTVPAEYSTNPEDGKTQAQLDATVLAQEYKNNLAATQAAEYAEERRLRDEANKISPEDNADVQEVVNTMANTGDNAVNPRNQDGPVDSTGGDSTAGSTNYTAAGSTAPLDIEQTNPTFVAPEMEAAKVSGYGMLTPGSSVQALDEAGQVVIDDVAAKRAAAYSQASPDMIRTGDAVQGAEYTATGAEGTDVTAAQGEISQEAQAQVDDAQLTERAQAAQREAAAEQAARASVIEYDVNQDAYVDKVTGKVASVQETREAEAKTREAITGEPAPEGEAAQIMSMYEYNQLERRTISKDKVVKNLKAQGLKDEEIAKRLADNPELVADEMDEMPEDIKTTLSGLPQEALMSAQMESLMAGMEDGEIPTWARPALAKVEANLAKRGMSASSVGRDALFNAIIQSAMPIAQSNAQAIQNATSQDKQIAADFLSKNAGFQQQMTLANLSNDQQMRLANLTAQNQASSENLNSAQQTELANLNSRMQTNLLQGKIAAEMNQAQLSVDQQRAVQNASMVANIDVAKFNAGQQIELANSKFMQTMVATEFSAEQQAAMQNATALASMDMANLDKNAKLAVQNAQAFLQMDMTNLSNEQQANVMKAQNQQQAMLSTQAAENAAKQFGAANQQQADQFMANLGVQVAQYNSSASAARDQFNATEKNRLAAINAGNDLQAQQFNEQLNSDVQKFNEQQDFQRDQWNAANAQAVEQSNTQWRRQANLADTAAQNAANQQNAQIAYNLTSQEQTQLWQQLRDEAAYIRQNFENEQQRKAQLLATAIGNEKIGGRSSSDASSWVKAVIGSI